MLAGALLLITATSLAQKCPIDGSVVEAGSGSPVSRVQVVVEGGQDIGATTDADGKFSIAAESCGKAQLVVSKSGFETQRLSKNNPQGIFIRLQRVSGVSGVVSDADGQPIADAVVDVGMFFPDSRMFAPTRMSATVSQSGEYALTPGQLPFPFAVYRICAHSDAGVYPVGGGHKLRYADRCIDTTIDAGQQKRLDITLTPLAPVHVSGSIAGAPDGAVAVVSIYRQGRENQSAMTAKSAIGGLYDFEVLPDVYTIEASAVYGDKPFFASEEVTVGSGGIGRLALTLLPGIDLTGSVRFKSSTAQRARVRLDLSPASGWSVEWNEAHDSFTISNVLQRKYRLGVLPMKDDGSAVTDDFYVQSVRMRDEDVQGREFSVVGGAAPLEIVLADDIGTLAGTVADAEGKPVSSTVRVRRSGGLISPGPTRQEWMIGSDNEGRFGIKIPPGEYVVYATDGLLRDAPDDASKVEVPPSGRVNVSLKRVDRQ